MLYEGTGRWAKMYIVESTPRVPMLGGGSKASVLSIWFWSLAVPSCCD